MAFAIVTFVLAVAGIVVSSVGTAKAYESFFSEPAINNVAVKNNVNVTGTLNTNNFLLTRVLQPAADALRGILWVDSNGSLHFLVNNIDIVVEEQSFLLSDGSLAMLGDFSFDPALEGGLEKVATINSPAGSALVINNSIDSSTTFGLAGFNNATFFQNAFKTSLPFGSWVITSTTIGSGGFLTGNNIFNVTSIEEGRGGAPVGFVYANSRWTYVDAQPRIIVVQATTQITYTDITVLPEFSIYVLHNAETKASTNSSIAKTILSLSIPLVTISVVESLRMYSGDSFRIGYSNPSGGVRTGDVDFQVVAEARYNSGKLL